MLKFLLALLLLIAAVTATAQRNTVIIRNVNIIAMTKDTVLKNQEVGLRMGKVIFIRPATTTVNAARIIDGTGKYLVPALYDMHIHWPEHEPLRFLQLCTAAGIAQVRMMKSEPAAQAFKKMQSQRTDLPWQVIGYPVYPTDSMPLEKVAAWADTIRQNGYAFIKFFGVASEPLFKEIVKQARRNNLPVCGHSLANIPALTVLNRGYRSVEHVGYFDKKPAGPGFDSLVTAARANGTYVCPTLDWVNMVYHSYPQAQLPQRAGYAIGNALYQTHWDTTYQSMRTQLGANEKKYADFMTDNLQKKMAVLLKLHQAGIPIIAGSDAEEPYQTPGFSLVEELLLMEKAGLSRYEVLKTATVNAAAYFAEPRLRGTVETGTVTRLLLLDKNPLDDLRNLAATNMLFREGSVIDCKALLQSIR
jgi:hypothetical protein